MEITNNQVHQAYRLSKSVHNGKKQKLEAVNELTKICGMNSSSAEMYILVFDRMVLGEEYRRTINAYATEYYLENIFKDYGISSLLRAIESLKKHIDYYRSVGKSSPKRVQEILEKYTLIAQENQTFLHFSSSEKQKDNLIDEIEEFEKISQSIPETIRKSIIQSRIGQGQFRLSLIDFWKGCSVTGCQKIEILKASHIKPWRSSDNDERLDVYNGLLLLPNLDTCFDLGFISFNDEGKILISKQLSRASLVQLGINPEMRLLKVEQKHKEFLAYHRKKVVIT